MPGSSTAEFTVRSSWTHAAPTSVLFVEYAAGWLDRQRLLTDGGLLRISSLHRYESALRAHLLPFFGALP